MDIKIAEGLSLPTDAVTQTFAQIGKRGAGKTYLASMIAEQMLDAQAQVIVLDPIGNWWGLRVNADGTSKGKDIYVMGGSHGDMPLSAESGKEIAKILTEKNLSVVLDISEFRKNERKRFVTDFAEEFFHLKKANPSAVHIFLEESQKFVPQRVMKDDARMLGAWEDIVRLGRNYGIGCSLISQRPQSVNKEVLSQVECLCVLQVVGRHERKALEEWVKEAGEERDIVDKLPGLKTGEGYVWSPSWLRIFKKVKFNKKTTMDTGATPKLGKATKVAKLSKMDIKKLQKFMTDVAEKTQKELKDTKDFKNEISRLNKELSLTKKGMPIQKVKVDTHAIEKAKSQGFIDAERQFSQSIRESEKETKKLSYWYQKEIKNLENKINSIKNILGSEVKKIDRDFPEIKPISKISPQKPIINNPIPIKTNNNLEVAPENSFGDEEVKLNLCTRRVYSFLYHNQGREFSRTQLAVVTGYSQKSGGFKDAISKLNVLDLISKNGNKVSVKNMNEEFATEPSEEITMDVWLRKLNKCTRTILKFLLDRPNESFDREEVANETGYSISSGGFKDAISKLNVLGMIAKEGSYIKLDPEILEL